MLKWRDGCSREAEFMLACSFGGGGSSAHGERCVWLRRTEAVCTMKMVLIERGICTRCE